MKLQNTDTTNRLNTLVQTKNATASPGVGPPRNANQKRVYWPS